MKFNINKIDHLGIAVESLEAGRALYDALGLHFLGEETVESDGVRTAFFQTGESNVELLEPTRDDSPVAKFLAKRGPGLHHVALGVENIEAAVAELKAKGVVMIDETPREGAHGKRVAFIHPKSAGGVLLELCERPAGGEKA